VAEGALWDVMVVGGDVADRGIFHVLPGAEAAGGLHLGDAAFEAIHHPFGLWGAGLDKALVDCVGGTLVVEKMVAGRLELAGRTEPVGEFLAVVGQHLGYLEKGGLPEGLQKVLGALGGLRGDDLHVDLAGGPILGLRCNDLARLPRIQGRHRGGGGRLRRAPTRSVPFTLQAGAMALGLALSSATSAPVGVGSPGRAIAA
jgi:hypothetical protein